MEEDPELRSLACLPGPWLLQFLAALDTDAASALFQTCTVVRDLMLERRAVCLSFQLPFTVTEAALACKALARASKLSTTVKLRLRRAQGVQDEDINACASGLLHGTMAATSQGLAIKAVEIRGLQLNAIVPSWLIDTCPHLTSLQFHTCHFSLLPSSSPPSNQLKELRLINPPVIVATQMQAQQWLRQLAALSGLESVSLH